MRKFVSGKERTETYVGAVETLSELLAAQGEDAVSRAFAEASAEARFGDFARSRGLKLSDGRLCIHRLSGRQCDLKDCFPPVGDHDTLWIRDGKPAVYLAQPYQLEWEELKGLVEFCVKNGLRAGVDTWPSFHFPAHVLSVHITRRDGGRAE